MIIIENLDSCLYYEIEFDLYSIFNRIIKDKKKKFKQNEDINDIDKFLYHDKRLNDVEIKQRTIELDNIFSTDVKHLLDRCILKDGLIKLNRTNGSHKNCNDVDNKNLLSYSYYFNLSFIGNTDDIHVSDKVRKRITNILIKCSTHLTNKQNRDIFGDNSGLTGYLMHLPDVCEQKIRNCFTNIYNNYIDFMINMSNDSNYYEDFNDIPEKARNLLTEYAKQNID
jgi:hypothetical protein